MLTTVLMFLAAVLLSIIAGYYSVIGMTAIFSGSFVAVLLMASTLEASKVIVASWLYNNWKKTPLLLKTYLTTAVVVLMFITSMGIFGFLSKAHIQQTAAGAQATAQIERLAQEIDVQNKVVDMATKRMNDLMSGGQGGDASVNLRITQANKVIESANARVQPQIDDQQKIIDQENAKVEARVNDIQTQIADIDREVEGLDAIVKGLVDQQRSVLAQRKKDEQGPQRDELAKKKANLLKQIDSVRNAKNPTIEAAKAEIAKIRAGVDQEVKQARDAINELTGQLGKNVDSTKLQSDIDEQSNRIKVATARLDELSQEKFKLETANRQLEVEVGPIKYIAQMIYGDVVDMNMLERAVRYMILTLIFVFDPLAILMLIASNQGLAEWKSSRFGGSWMGFKRRREDAPVPPPPPVASVHAREDLEGRDILDQIRAAISAATVTGGTAMPAVEDAVRKPIRLSEVAPAPTLSPDPLPVEDADVQAPVNDVKSDTVLVEPAMPDLVGTVQVSDSIEIKTVDAPPPERAEQAETIAETTSELDISSDIAQNLDADDSDGTLNRMPEQVVDDPGKIGSVTDTEDLLGKLQRVHDVRLSRFNAQPNNPQ